MIDEDLDEFYEQAWDDGYRAALRVLHEADEAVEGDQWATLVGLLLPDRRAGR
jgi:hypothetical protein